MELQQSQNRKLSCDTHVTCMKLLYNNSLIVKQLYDGIMNTCNFKS